MLQKTVDVKKAYGRYRTMESHFPFALVLWRRDVPGWVNRLTEPGQALAVACALAERVAANGPLAVRMSKQVMAQSPGWPAEQRWARQRVLLEEVIASHDAREGSLAFAEKRPPAWTGR